ncbi:type I 3-dehydroquinate dehydratase [Patescibacteria group bacterium]|nr:MAG: type I 3-dehydroquinate dehydratase [Patescibacteria group bacterium]
MKPKPFYPGVVCVVNESKLPRFRLALETLLARPELCDTIEIRLDGIREHLYQVWAQIIELAQCKPVILTFRSKECGGREVISLEERLTFWHNLPKGVQELIDTRDSRVFVDWELELHEQWYHGPFGSVCGSNPPPFPWRQVIASEHDFEGTPTNPGEMLFRLEDTRAEAFLKLVTRANSERDVERLRGLFDGRSDPRPLASFAMGALGEVSRFECMGWGSCATYGYLEGFGNAAPGQVSVQRLMADPSVQRARKMFGFK